MSRASAIAEAGFGGTFGALSKIAKKSNLVFKDFVTSEVRFDGDRRYRWFTPTKLLIENGSHLSG